MKRYFLLLGIILAPIRILGMEAPSELPILFHVTDLANRANRGQNVIIRVPDGITLADAIERLKRTKNIPATRTFQLFFAEAGEIPMNKLPLLTLQHKQGDAVQIFNANGRAYSVEPINAEFPIFVGLW